MSAERDFRSMLDGDWAFEVEQRGYAQGMKLSKRLHQVQTPFQNLEIVDTTFFGRALVLDGAVQTTERDEFMYHEMLVHVPLMTHPGPRRVLIIGAGDGGALRRVLEHPSAEPTQVEIDAEVISFCQENIPTISAGAYVNPRARVIVGDGVQYLRNNPGVFDVVIIDSTDPVGPAVQLFEAPFYRDVARSLSEDGLMVAQSSSPLFMADEMKSQVANLRTVFPIVRTYLGIVSTYPGCLWSYSIGSKRHDPATVPAESIEQRLTASGIATRYYTADVHRAAFALPPFVSALLA